MDALRTALAEYRVAPELDIFVVPDFALRHLETDATVLQAQLEARYPVRRADDEIVPARVQWVEGSNPALRYRGRELKRGKVWLQIDDPLANGYLRYFYTGWQWAVLPATASVDECPEVSPMVRAYNAWASALGCDEANHFIVTKYENGEHNIGWHYDKDRDIAADSLISVIKTGAHGRPFELRHRRADQKAQQAEPPFFSRVLAPGTAVIMTVAANLATQHSVPVVDDVGSSGSIVFRTITTRVAHDELTRKLGQRRAKKRAREDGED